MPGDYFENLEVDFSGKTVFLDIDGTLLPDTESRVEQVVLQQIEKIKRNNFLFFCTNHPDVKRNGDIESTSGVLIANRQYKKPNKKILEEVSARNANFLVIGDKFITDGIFAKNIGADFIIVKRKVSGTESIATKLIYFADSLIYNLYKLFI